MSDHEEIKRQINRIRQGGLEERRAAVDELVAQGEPAVGPLIAALLAEPDPDPRWYLAGALGRIGSPGVAPLLAAMKEHSDHDFRRYAAAALGEVRGSAIRPLIRIRTGRSGSLPRLHSAGSGIPRSALSRRRVQRAVMWRHGHGRCSGNSGKQGL